MTLASILLTPNLSPSPQRPRVFLLFPNSFFSLLPEPDLPPALVLEIVSRITLANKGGFFIVKSVNKGLEQYKSLLKRAKAKKPKKIIE